MPLTLVLALASPSWTVQIDPLTTTLGFVHVQVERALSPNWSVYLGPSLRLFNAPFGDQHDLTGLGAEAGVRWFFRPEAPAGFWLGVRGVLAHLSTEARGLEETAWGGYGSALGGHTWILGGWVVLSAGLGVQYLHYTVGGEGPEGILPAAHTTLGVAF